MNNDSDKPSNPNLELSINLTPLEETIGYHFKDKTLLIQALTHSSFAYEANQEDISDNQRLEFLGDSILNMVTAEYLYKKHGTFAEGELTRLRALLVNRDNLNKKAIQLNLGRYLLLGKGEEKCNGRQNSTNLSGALEALIAAIYFDSGLTTAQEFILQILV